MKKINFMRKYLQYYSSCLLLICCMACEKPDPKVFDGTIYSENYVLGYLYDVDSMAVSSTINENGTLYKYGNGLSFAFWGNGCNANTNRETFLSYAKQYNDVSYHQSVYEGRRNVMNDMSLAEPIRSISVVSDMDMDAVHPAGTSLNDIIYFSAASPKNFILNGYPKVETNEPGYDYGYQLVQGFLSELDPEDLVLLDIHDIYIDFPEVPLIKEHNFTVTVTFANGKVLTALCNKKFE